MDGLEGRNAGMDGRDGRTGWTARTDRADGKQASAMSRNGSRQVLNDPARDAKWILLPVGLPKGIEVRECNTFLMFDIC